MLGFLLKVTLNWPSHTFAALIFCQCIVVSEVASHRPSGFLRSPHLMIMMLYISLLLLVKRQIGDDYGLKLFDCSPAIYIRLESPRIM